MPSPTSYKHLLERMVADLFSHRAEGVPAGWAYHYACAVQLGDLRLAFLTPKQVDLVESGLGHWLKVTWQETYADLVDPQSLQRLTSDFLAEVAKVQP